MKRFTLRYRTRDSAIDISKCFHSLYFAKATGLALYHDGAINIVIDCGEGDIMVLVDKNGRLVFESLAFI